jgi:hypothetical protein
MAADGRREPAAAEPAATAEETAQGEPVEGDSAKLLRLTVMAYELLDEVRHMRLDERGRQRLRAIHEATVAELKGLLPENLRHELDAVSLPLGEAATESEVRLAQIQLVGWLEGLMHGIQAALWATVVHALSHDRRPLAIEKAPETQPGPYL